jgi:hypothetical protein
MNINFAKKIFGIGDEAEFFRSLPNELRRSIILKINEDRFLIISGLGLTNGPPYCYPSYTNSDLIYGLMSSKYAEKEIETSKWLIKNGIPCIKPISYVNIKDTYLQKLNINSILEASTIEYFVPSALLSEIKSPYLVKDLTSKADILINELITLMKETDPKRAMMKFCFQLANNICKYQRLGAYNDGLISDSINLAGEIIELGRFKTSDELSIKKINHEIIESRQKNEVYSYLNVVLDLSEILKIDVNIKETALNITRRTTEYCDTNFYKEMHLLA